MVAMGTSNLQRRKTKKAPCPDAFSNSVGTHLSDNRHRYQEKFPAAQPPTTSPVKKFINPSQVFGLPGGHILRHFHLVPPSHVVPAFTRRIPKYAKG